MKKIMSLFALLFLVVGFIVFTPQADAATNAGLVKVVETKTTTIHEKASDSSKKILTLSKNKPVVQLSSSNGWAKVQIGETIGYTKLSSLKIKEFNYRALKAATPIKLTDSKKSKTLVTVPKAAAIKNYGSVGNGLIFVQYGNHSGYMEANATKPTTSSVAYPTFSDSMFSLPDNKGEVVEFVNMYEKVIVLSEGPQFSFVKYGSKYGYMETGILVNKLYYKEDYMPICKNVTFASNTCKKLSNNYVKIYSDGYEYMDYVIEADMLNITVDSTLSLIFPVYKGASMPITLTGNTFTGKVTNVGLTKKYHNKTLNNVFELSLYDQNTLALHSKYYFAPGYGLLVGL